jgi:PAS domain S-box-containing protein
MAERFFDLSMDMLCVAGVDGYFKMLNPAWARTLGHSAEELMSQPFLAFVHPDDRDGTIAEASKLASGFQTISFRNRYRCKDGSYKWLAWTATPAFADGTIFAGARDVTNAALAEEAGLQLLREQLVRVRSAIEGDGLTIVFQPILRIDTREVCGFEALSRFECEPHRPPDVWFAEADAVGFRPQLEMRAIRDAVWHAHSLPGGAYLSVNASPETLLSRDFAALVGGLERGPLVVEITEHAAVEDYEQVKRAIDRLRGSGVRLAIDDAGAGFSSLKHIIRLVPEFIKLDVFLTRDVDIDPVKQALVSALVTFVAQISARLIAEGVETAEELRALAELGVEYAQGFYLGRPAPLTS